MHPTKLEIAEIYELWKHEFAFDDGGSIDDYFQRNFKAEYCFVHRINQRIVSTLCAHPHPMLLHSTSIPVIFISGVITKQEFRHQGYMKELFKQVFATYKDTCALYILQAYHPEIYEPLGFQMQYYTYEYDVIESYHTSKQRSILHNASDLLEVSEIFLSHYEGYLIRDLAYYENYLSQARAQNSLLYGIYQDHHLQGFALAFEQQDTLRMEELMYRDNTVYKQLIALAQQSYKQVQIVQSIPHTQWKSSKHGNLMVRIGNESLLKNILQRDISTLEDVYGKLIKPLYHYDFW